MKLFLSTSILLILLFSCKKSNSEAQDDSGSIVKIEAMSGGADLVIRKLNGSVEEFVVQKYDLNNRRPKSILVDLDILNFIEVTATENNTELNLGRGGVKIYKNKGDKDKWTKENWH